MSDPNDIHSTAFLPVTAHDAKTEIEQIDITKELSATNPQVESSPLIVSAYADYTTGATIKLFKRLFIAGFLVSFSGIYLGFTLNVPGSVIANKGGSLLSFLSCSSLTLNRICSTIRYSYRCTRGTTTQCPIRWTVERHQFCLSSHLPVPLALHCQ